MSKQIYIDSNGNEVLVSGTVNSADMLPIEAGSSKMTSGAIATFDTSLALPLQDCTIDINAVQESGTPTPSSPKAISGFTGANITNHSKNYLDTSTNVNGKALSATGVETSVPAACYTDLIKVVGGKKYTFGATSAIVDAWNRRIHGYDESGNWVQEIMNSNSKSYAVGTPFTMTFTVPSGISYIRISYYKDTNAQLEKGESASAYQAYNSTTTAISWQTEAGTVYGGSLDVTTGVLTVTHKVIDMGSLTWNTVGMGGGRTGFKSTISDIELAPAATVVFNGKCECYASLNGNDVYLGNTGIATWGANTHDIAVYDTDRESLSGNDFKTAVTGSDLVYTLQTPVTYQLTPIQISAIVGTNNVFTDTNGDTSVVYYTNKTVKDAINEVNDKADTNTTSIGDLSDLTTSVTSSLVGAVNEVNANKPTNTVGSPYLKVKTTANITKSINANGYASILGSDIDLAEKGYIPIGIVSMYNTQSAGCFFGSFDCSVVSGSATFAIVKNTSTSNITATMNFKILFMRTTN